LIRLGPWWSSARRCRSSRTVTPGCERPTRDSGAPLVSVQVAFAGGRWECAGAAGHAARAGGLRPGLVVGGVVKATGLTFMSGEKGGRVWQMFPRDGADGGEEVVARDLSSGRVCGGCAVRDWLRAGRRLEKRHGIYVPRPPSGR